MQLGSFLEVVTFISAILTILLILLQQRGASLGAGFGSSGELYTTRRGLVEKRSDPYHGSVLPLNYEGGKSIS